MSTDSKRIRYVKHGLGGLVSMRAYKDAEGNDLQARINPDMKSGSIVFASTETSIITFTATSPHKLKIKLKAALEALGVDFAQETRYDKETTT